MMMHLERLGRLIDGHRPCAAGIAPAEFGRLATESGRLLHRGDAFLQQWSEIVQFGVRTASQRLAS